jgi:hypothetical protein
MEIAMRASKLALVFLVLAAGALTASSAYAWGRTRVFVGFNFGFPAYYPAYYPGPFYYPAYYPAPYYYYPAPVVVQSPPVYTERHDIAPPTTDLNGYWYYCGASKGYYPYVKECPGGWQKVPPQPPS